MLARTIQEAVLGRSEWAFGYLERLIAAPTTAGHEHSGLDIFESTLVELGFVPERIPLGDIARDPRAGVPAGPALDRSVRVGRRGAGASGPSLLLNGHMDVVPAESPELWTSPPFTPQRRGGRLYGRGAGDMKCGFAMGALAIAALDEVDPGAISGPLAFLAVIEEENTGNGTLAAARAGVLADAVVLLEPTGLGVLLAGIGVLWLEITVTGRAAHAQAAHEAVNAVDLAYQVIDALRSWQRWIGTSTRDEVFDGVESPYNLNVGGLDAGDWTSSVPATARLRVRVGFPRAWSPEEAEGRAREIVENTARAGAFPALPTVRSSGLRAPGYSLPEGHPLDLAVRAAHHEAHGTRPETVVMGSTTDARIYLNHHGVPALCYGPDASAMHGVDESVGLQSIVDGAITLAHFLRSYYRATAPGMGAPR